MKYFVSTLTGLCALVFFACFELSPRQATADRLSVSPFDTPTTTATSAPNLCPPAWSIIPNPDPGRTVNTFNGVAALSANDVWAAGVYYDSVPERTLVEHWDGSTWSVVPSPNPGSFSSNLEGLAGVSANDVWAVGDYSNGGGSFQTLVEHWDGTAWSVVPSPNPAGLSSTLYGVAAVSSNDVWAVGYGSNGTTEQTLIEHWDGNAWAIVPGPNPGPAGNGLQGITEISADDVWAAGHSYSTGHAQTLIEHWDGSAWTVVPAPGPDGFDNYLDGVTAVSAGDVWAVGGSNSSTEADQTLIEHWDGTVWRVVPGGSPGTIDNVLYGVSAVSANDVWAVGSFANSNTTSETLAEHWNGGTWSVVSTPNMGTDNYLSGAAALSADEVWAVGTSSSLAVVERWSPVPCPTSTPTQTATPTSTPTCAPVWTVVSSPNVGTYANELSAVAAISANDIWAVGAYNTGGTWDYRSLAEHWDGTAWSVVPSPDPAGGTFIQLNGLAAVSANDVWAVGYYLGSSAYQTLIEHWDGTAWSIVPGAALEAGGTLSGVAALAADNVWAVGGTGTNQTLVEHWDGTSWSVIPSPSPSADNNWLNAVAAVSADDIWAVGSSTGDSGYTYDTLVEHWDGTAWSVVPSPGLGPDWNFLRGVAVVSASDVWAVGDHTEPGGQIIHTLVEHWDGTAWSLVPSADPAPFGINGLRGVTALSTNDVWAAGYYDVSGTNMTLVEHWDGSAWSTISSPNLGSYDNSLGAIAEVSTGDVWAVGDYDKIGNNGLYQTLVEHYASPCVSPTSTPTVTPTNTATVTPTSTVTPDPCAPVWSVIPSPNLGDNASELFAVAAVSAADIWAVGSYYNGSADQAMVEHWDGTAWSAMPAPGSGSNSYLLGLAAIAANNVWVVGYSSSGTLVEHWDGTAWSVVPSPGPGRLYAVAAIAANNVWVVGYAAPQTLVEHWDGTAWSMVLSPSPGMYDSELRSLTAVSASDVWAVGAQSNSAYGPGESLVEHWDGLTWSVVPNPSPGSVYNTLRGVAAVSPDDVWATGYYYNSDNLYKTLVEHWDGVAWSVVPSPNPGPISALLGIEAISDNDIWAVGTYSAGTPATLVEHWDGTSWAVVTSPYPGDSDNELFAVAAVSASDVWSVGRYANTAGPIQTLVEHYASPCAPTSTPTQTPTPILVGHVTWQGRPAQPSALQQLPVTLTLKSGSTEIDYPTQTTNARGNFTVCVGSLAPGTYDWRVKGPKYLANSGQVTLNGSPSTSAEMGLMKAGDCNNDNLVNTSDFNIVKGAFGKSIGQQGYDDRADFTGDQVVNGADYNLLRGNFAQGGAPPISPGRDRRP